MAHLTAAASLDRWRWVRSMLGARFRVDVHNQRRMAEHRGRTPAETLELFRAIIASTTAPSGHTPAYLGEVVVHSQDIRQPLGLARTPDIDALTPVAHFFARRDFTVPSRTTVAGLQLRADDGPFATDSGPLVTGSTLALVMSMAGRAPYLYQIDGPGDRPCGHASSARIRDPPRPSARPRPLAGPRRVREKGRAPSVMAGSASVGSLIVPGAAGRPPASWWSRLGPDRWPEQLP